MKQLIDHLEILITIMKAHPEGDYRQSISDAFDMETERQTVIKNQN